VKNKR